MAQWAQIYRIGACDCVASKHVIASHRSMRLSRIEACDCVASEHAIESHRSMRLRRNGVCRTCRY
jgi:hypothetical protein